MKSILTILTICICFVLASSQDVEFTMDDFIKTGDAIEADDQCFQLTESVLWQGGAIWYRKPIDLSEPFEMEIDVSFGCNDAGADGIVFIFHPELTTGYEGEGMGFGGLFPSFVIEMDTYENYHLADPSFDHVAFMANGRPHHHMGLTEPVPLNGRKRDVEDCGMHRVLIKWSPKSKAVQFFFDGDLRLQSEIDLVDRVFFGDPVVYWGFTSATGGRTNRHLVCLEKLVFETVENHPKTILQQLLDGQSYTLQGIEFAPGSTTLPAGAANELDRLVDILKEYPTHTISIHGFTDSSGDAERNKELSRLRAKAIADYLRSKGLPPGKVLFRGHGETNPIAPNDTPEGRRKNRRIEVMMQILKV